MIFNYLFYLINYAAGGLVNLTNMDEMSFFISAGPNDLVPK